MGLNGRPQFAPNEAVSFVILSDDQAETDRLLDAIVGNGKESMCGWCKDRWGFSWQITPRALLAATTDPDRAAAKCYECDAKDRRRRHRGCPRETVGQLKSVSR